MKLFLIYIVFLSFCCEGCINYDTYYLKSPDREKELRFEWITYLNPNKKAVIRITTAENKFEKQICIRSFMDFPIHIYWGDTLKIRGGILVKDNSLYTAKGYINWEQNYTPLEEKEISSHSIKWQHYYPSKISEGYYK